MVLGARPRDIFQDQLDAEFLQAREVDFEVHGMDNLDDVLRYNAIHDGLEKVRETYFPVPTNEARRREAGADEIVHEIWLMSERERQAEERRAERRRVQGAARRLGVHRRRREIRAHIAGSELIPRVVQAEEDRHRADRRRLRVARQDEEDDVQELERAQQQAVLAALRQVHEIQQQQIIELSQRLRDSIIVAHKDQWERFTRIHDLEYLASDALSRPILDLAELLDLEKQLDDELDRAEEENRQIVSTWNTLRRNAPMEWKEELERTIGRMVHHRSETLLNMMALHIVRTPRRRVTF